MVGLQRSNYVMSSIDSHQPCKKRYETLDGGSPAFELCHELRKTNAWSLEGLLKYDAFRFRTPSRQESYVILEALNMKSKDWGWLSTSTQSINDNLFWDFGLQP